MSADTRIVLSRKTRFKRYMKRAYEHKTLYLIFLPVLAWYIIFAYMPMFNPQTGGIFLAFKHFRMNMPFAEMEWVGLQWFNALVSRPDFLNAFYNTIIISVGRLIIEFPLPIIIAILLNELRINKFKRSFQTIFTFPFFLSWILVIGIMRDFLMMDGAVNAFIRSIGGTPFNFMANADRIPNLLLVFLSNIWKNAGWGAIIFMAAISGIDPTLYEAAHVDGANRWQCIRHITWPSIKSTAIVLLILQIGGLMNAGFDQIFNLQNSVNMRMLNILDTYIYHMAFSVMGGAINMGFIVAAGLFRSAINFTLLVIANFIAKVSGDYNIF